MGDRQRNLSETGARSPGRRFVLPATLLSVLLATLFSTVASAGKHYPFDMSGYLGEATLMPDWADTMNREALQSVALDACLASSAVTSYIVTVTSVPSEMISNEWSLR